MRKLLFLLAVLVALPASARQPWDSAVLGDRTTGLYADGFMSVMLVPGSPGLQLSSRSDEGYATTGVAEIDALCAAHSVRAIHPYYEGNHPPGPAAEVLKRWYLFEMDQGLDVHAACADLTRLGVVENAVPHYVHEVDQVADPVDDPSFSSQWALPRIEAPYAWHYAPSAGAIRIDIADTGVEWGHDDLYNVCGVNTLEDINASGLFENWSSGSGGDLNNVDDDGNGYIDDVVGWDFYDYDNNPTEDAPEHGTHVAGCATASTNNALGIAGTAYDARLMITKHSDETTPYIWSGFNGVIYSNALGCELVNCSWGGYGYDPNQQTFLNAAPILLVGSAGNDGVSTPHYPSAYNYVLSVGSTTQNDTKAGFSNYGSTIDVMAPGVDIVSTWMPNTYTGLQGTSMSSPIAAGVCALVFANNPGADRDSVTNIVKSTCDDIYPLNPGYPYPNLGEGRVNAYAAIASFTHSRMAVTDVAVTETSGDGDGIFDPGENADVVLTLSVDWNTAANISMTFTSLDADLTVNDGTASFGTINVGNSGTNASDPFTVSAAWDTSPHDALVQVYATANGGTDEYYDTVAVPISMVLSGFPLALGDNCETNPTAYDLDGDGTDEIIVGAGSDVCVLNHDGSSFSGWPQTVNATLAVGGAAVGDIDNDGAPEIVVTTKAAAGSVYAFETNGTLMSGFPFATTMFIYGAPALADLDGGGDLEIIFGGFDAKLHAVDHTGSEITGFPYDLGGGGFILGGVAIGDVDADADYEIAFGSQNGNVYVLNHDGSLVAGWPVATGAAVTSTPAMGNLDGDSEDEIVVGSRSDSVFAFNGDGSALSGWPVALSSDVQCAIALGDVTSASGLEVIVGTDNGDLYVFSAAGALQSGWPVATGGQVKNGVAVADFDNDGLIEVTVAPSTNTLCAYNPDASVVQWFPIETPVSCAGGPTVADVDANASAEILVGLASADPSFIVYDIHRSFDYNVDVEWGMYAHDPQHTANYGTPIVSAPGDAATVPSVFALHAAFPNPFNPATTIAFDLPASSAVRLDVYNVLGQRVGTLVDGTMPAGSHEVTWDASSVGSGVYFARITTDENTATTKMVLLK